MIPTTYTHAYTNIYLYNAYTSISIRISFKSSMYTRFMYNCLYLFKHVDTIDIHAVPAVLNFPRAYFRLSDKPSTDRSFSVSSVRSSNLCPRRTSMFYIAFRLLLLSSVPFPSLKRWGGTDKCYTTKGDTVYLIYLRFPPRLHPSKANHRLIHLDHLVPTANTEITLLGTNLSFPYVYSAGFDVDVPELPPDLLGCGADRCHAFVFKLTAVKLPGLAKFV